MDLFWQALAGLVVVVGPWKAGIVFAERTTDMSRPARRTTAVYTVVIAAIAGLVFIVIGDPLLEFFHISEAAFLIGAGLIVVVFSIRMVVSDEEGQSVRTAEDGETDDRRQALRLAIYPLSVPLVLTPPGLASLIALGVIAQLNNEAVVAVVGAFTIVMLVNLVVFLLESQYEDRIPSGIYQVAGRLLGVLLVAFGVTILIDGLKELGVLSG